MRGLSPKYCEFMIICETNKMRTGLQIQVTCPGIHPQVVWQVLGSRYWNNIAVALGFTEISGYTRQRGVGILRHRLWLL